MDKTSLKSKRVFFIAIGLVIVVAGLMLFTRSESDNTTKCQEALKESAEIMRSARTNDMKRASQLLLKQDGCKNTRNIDKATPAVKLQKFRYYHSLALSTYLSGSVKEAKTYAESGLKIAQTLTAGNKNQDHVKRMITELDYVKRGVY